MNRLALWIVGLLILGFITVCIQGFRFTLRSRSIKMTAIDNVLLKRDPTLEYPLGKISYSLFPFSPETSGRRKLVYIIHLNTIVDNHCPTQVYFIRNSSK